MNIINSIMDTPINTDKVAKVQALYEDSFPEFVQRMLSYMEDVVFIDDDLRLLSYREVVNASEELHVDFQTKCILPLIDCGDNDFISYGTDDGTWFLYNIVENVKFKERESLGELL